MVIATTSTQKSVSCTKGSGTFAQFRQVSSDLRLHSSSYSRHYPKLEFARLDRALHSNDLRHSAKVPEPCKRRCENFTRTLSQANAVVFGTAAVEATPIASTLSKSADAYAKCRIVTSCACRRFESSILKVMQRF